MFAAKRVYNQTNPKTGIQDWYFDTREGVNGPYECKEIAEFVLAEYVKFNLNNLNSGGRGPDGKISTLAHVQLDSSIEVLEVNKPKTNQSNQQKSLYDKVPTIHDNK